MAIAIINTKNGTTGFGYKTHIGLALNTTTTVLHCLMIVIVGSELCMRAIMAAIFVFPCEYQNRQWCGLEYKMVSSFFLYMRHLNCFSRRGFGLLCWY